MPNLTLRDRDGVWWAYGTVGGQRVRQSLGARDRSVAEELCSQLETRLWKRHSYGEEAVRTFEEAALNYMKQGGERRYLVPLIRHFKGRAVASIKPGEVRAAALTLYPNAAAATRNRQAITPARAVINHAHDMGWSPAIRVKLFEAAKARKPKPADRAWLDAFMAQADADNLGHLSVLVLFMHQTGARVSESIRLTGEHVDLSRRIAVLARTKTDEWSPRHLTSELVLRLGALGLEDEQPVFSYTDRSAVNRRMADVCKRAGIERRSTHAAGRHSFGTNAMAVPGARVKAAMEAGGWKSVTLFMATYVHDDDGPRELASKFDTATGPIGISTAEPLKRKGYRFGKKG